MLKRCLHNFLGLSLAATLTGCHIPANSPLTGLAQLRPIATPQTNVLPPATMLQHPGPGVEGPGPGVIMPASYELAMDEAGAGIEGEVMPWFEKRKKELVNRPLIREQAFGESLDVHKLERLGRYEVHLDRKLERMLSMLLRLKEMRLGTIPG